MRQREKRSWYNSSRNRSTMVSKYLILINYDAILVSNFNQSGYRAYCRLSLILIDVPINKRKWRFWEDTLKSLRRLIFLSAEM